MCQACSRTPVHSDHVCSPSVCSSPTQNTLGTLCTWVGTFRPPRFLYGPRSPSCVVISSPPPTFITKLFIYHNQMSTSPATNTLTLILHSHAFGGTVRVVRLCSMNPKSLTIPRFWEFLCELRLTLSGRASTPFSRSVSATGSSCSLLLRGVSLGRPTLQIKNDK